MKIAVIGGGMTGLVLADRLSEQGHAITLFEREPQFGGLATWHDFGQFVWDRFYHVILPTDRNLIGFLRDIGLESALRWKRTLTGFYVDKTFHSLSSGIDFLKFPPLGLLAKARLAFTILFCSRIEDWEQLERQKVGPWLRKLGGKRVFEKFWRPLLLAKLGEHHERVSAVFIWTYIKRMFSARDRSTQKEQLGYVSGGYRTVIRRIEERLRARGCVLRSGTTVQRVEATAEEPLSLTYDGDSERFDRVIFTAPTNMLEKVVAPALCSVSQQTAGSVEYLGVICMALVTRGPLVPYYIVNIADDQVPFTGIIGMSSLVASDETSGLSLTYLPKYVHSDDALLRAPDSQLRELFLTGLRRMFPSLDASQIVSSEIHRAVKVQPLQVIGYSKLVPEVRTAHPGFYVLNTAQFVANTLNNDEVVRAVDAFLDRESAAFASRRDAGANWDAVQSVTSQVKAA